MNKDSLEDVLNFAIDQNMPVDVILYYMDKAEKVVPDYATHLNDYAHVMKRYIYEHLGLKVRDRE